MHRSLAIVSAAERSRSKYMPLSGEKRRPRTSGYRCRRVDERRFEGERMPRARVGASIARGRPQHGAATGKHGPCHALLGHAAAAHPAPAADGHRRHSGAALRRPGHRAWRRGGERRRVRPGREPPPGIRRLPRAEPPRAQQDRRQFRRPDIWARQSMRGVVGGRNAPNLSRTEWNTNQAWRMAGKPPTVAQLKALLQQHNVKVSAKARLADLRQLCEDYHLVARHPPPVAKAVEKAAVEKTVERVCVVKCGRCSRRTPPSCSCPS
jgi:hypothetical protein